MEDFLKIFEIFILLCHAFLMGQLIRRILKKGLHKATWTTAKFLLLTATIVLLITLARHSLGIETLAEQFEFSQMKQDIIEAQDFSLQTVIVSYGVYFISFLLGLFIPAKKI